MRDTPMVDAMMKFCFGTDEEFVRIKDAAKLERELNAANERIKRLEEAGDMMALHAQLGGIPLDHIGWVNAWREAKKAKP